MRKQYGSALLVVMIMIVIITGMMVALMQYSMSTSQHIYYANESISREFAAEAGLARAEADYKSDPYWLEDNDGKEFTFNVEMYTITINVQSIGKDTDGFTCYLVQSSATDGIESKTVAHIAVNNPDVFQFGDYARFIEKGNMVVGNNSVYGGKVHVNGNININGKNVIFEEDVTATGNIKENNDTIFMKKHDSNVGYIPIPSVSDLINKEANAQENLRYDTDNSNFTSRFEVGTGYAPKSSDVVTINITFDTTDTGPSKGTTMTIVSTIDVPKQGNVPATTYTMTETFEINSDSDYYNKAIYCEGDVTVSGNTSGRNTIITPTEIKIDGPLRYVTEDGEPLWVFKDAKTGEVVPTDTIEEFENWSSMGQWDGSKYEYTESDELLKYYPTSEFYDPDANGSPPVLGLMAGKGIDVTGETFMTDGGEYSLENREINAALLCSESGVGYEITGQKSNLYINGCVINDGTEPASGPFSYRTFSYDPFLKLYPPPEFNSSISVGNYIATNWHLIQ